MPSLFSPPPPSPIPPPLCIPFRKGILESGGDILLRTELPDMIKCFYRQMVPAGKEEEGEHRVQYRHTLPSATLGRQSLVEPQGQGPPAELHWQGHLAEPHCRPAGRQPPPSARVAEPSGPQRYPPPCKQQPCSESQLASCSTPSVLNFLKITTWEGVPLLCVLGYGAFMQDVSMLAWHASMWAVLATYSYICIKSEP